MPRRLFLRVEHAISARKIFPDQELGDCHDDGKHKQHMQPAADGIEADQADHPDRDENERKRIQHGVIFPTRTSLFSLADFAADGAANHCATDRAERAAVG